MFLMTTDLTLVPVLRPNGKLYRPRKPPAAVVVPDHHDEYHWIYVLRTHDIARAHELATALALRWGFDLDDCEVWREWVHDAIEGGDRFWRNDPVRGVPTVIFELDI